MELISSQTTIAIRLIDHDGFGPIIKPTHPAPKQTSQLNTWITDTGLAYFPVQ